MQLFYTASIDPSHSNFILDEEESKHAIRVLRKQVGDVLHLIDGRGGLYEVEILDAHPKRTVLQVLNVIQEYNKPSYNLHIAVAPTKNIDRIEWFLEKATEVGVSEITPIICEHSERKEVKVERLEKVVIAAMKQSLKAYIPKVNPAISLKQFFNNHKETTSTKAIAQCVEADKKYLSDVFQKGGDYLVMIGPEGDFSTQEIETALALGFHPISLGDARLRTETAALTSCVEVSLLNR